MRFRIALILTVVAGSVLTWAQAPPAAQKGPQSKDTETTEDTGGSSSDPLRRSTPQSSVLSFLELCRAGKFERAARYIDLNKLPRAERQAKGPMLAKQLSQVLDSDAQFDVAELSRDREGDTSDGRPDRDVLVTYGSNGKTLSVDLERVRRDKGPAVWMIAADSVPIIPQLLQFTSSSPIEQYLPHALVDLTLLSTAIWRWIAFVLIIIAAIAFSGMLAKLTLLVLAPVVKKVAPSMNTDMVHLVSGPVRLLIAVGVIRAGEEGIAFSALARLYLDRSMSLLGWIGLSWLILRLIDLAVHRIQDRYVSKRHSSFLRSGMPVAVRIAKIVILTLTGTGLLSSWGYDTTTILAGLGIGGVAIALAAQKTIENLFGGVAVVSDRPVAVGDFCKFGDLSGTIEDIGLRSTRVRTPQRTMVSVPNGAFSSMVLENFSRRDKVLFHSIVNLRRDATPSQVREVLGEIDKLLRGNPKIEAGSLPVRLIGAPPASLDIEISVYILTDDDDEFLGLQQDLLLEILDIVAAAGTSLATPAPAAPPPSNPEPVPAGRTPEQETKPVPNQRNGKGRVEESGGLARKS
jgi:MscS family membrane protein